MRELKAQGLLPVLLSAQEIRGLLISFLISMAVGWIVFLRIR